MSKHVDHIEAVAAAIPHLFLYFPTCIMSERPLVAIIPQPDRAYLHLTDYRDRIISY